MPAGKVGDNPLTDLLVHGLHPFPQDIEAMILQIRDVVPRYLDQLSLAELADWEAGINLDAGRAHLRSRPARYEADLAKLLR